jgi:UDP-N-acetylmuramyl pentapeptide phosphotransferase/UDP-N-acetylglucosamine-1-phosphate transferase
VILPLTLLFGISLLDDVRGLPVLQRLSTHLVATAIFVGGSGLFAQHGVAVALVLMLLTVWMTNLYNFMDGSDGLAGGMALFGFAAYGIAALIAQDDMFAMLNFSISAAALGFLYHNFPPARVFMGDAGSIPLGFLAAAMGMIGWLRGEWAVWFPLLVFSPFIADASITLLKRTLRGARITEAHRDHYYQRVIQMGCGHRTVARTEYALMLFSGVLALLTLNQSFPWMLMLIWGALYGALMFLIDIAWKRFERGLHA